MNDETINVKIRLFAFMREKVGKSMLEINFTNTKTIYNILILLTHSYPDLKQDILTDENINSQLVVALNGENIDSLDIIVKEGDEIAIIPPSGGG